MNLTYMDDMPLIDFDKKDEKYHQDIDKMFNQVLAFDIDQVDTKICESTRSNLISEQDLEARNLNSDPVRISEPHTHISMKPAMDKTQSLQLNTTKAKPIAMRKKDSEATVCSESGVTYKPKQYETKSKENKSI